MEPRTVNVVPAETPISTSPEGNVFCEKPGKRARVMFPSQVLLPAIFNSAPGIPELLIPAPDIVSGLSIVSGDTWTATLLPAVNLLLFTLRAWTPSPISGPPNATVNTPDEISSTTAKAPTRNGFV